MYETPKCPKHIAAFRTTEKVDIRFIVMIKRLSTLAMVHHSDLLPRKHFIDVWWNAIDFCLFSKHWSSVQFSFHDYPVTWLKLISNQSILGQDQKSIIIEKVLVVMISKRQFDGKCLLENCWHLNVWKNRPSKIITHQPVLSLQKHDNEAETRFSKYCTINIRQSITLISLGYTKQRHMFTNFVSYS